MSIKDFFHEKIQFLDEMKTEKKTSTKTNISILRGQKKGIFG